jgi:hypothetical protein
MTEPTEEPKPVELTQQPHQGEPPELPEDQAAYARVLGPGVILSLVALAVTFVFYLAGTGSPQLGPHEIRQYWSMPADEFRNQAGVETGWAWLDRLPASDVLPNLGICLLAAISAVAYLRLVPIYLRQKRGLLVGIVLAELGLMALAASGIVSPGH